MRPRRAAHDCAVGHRDAHRAIATDLEQKTCSLDAGDHGLARHRKPIPQLREHAPENDFERADSHTRAFMYQCLAGIAKAKYHGYVLTRL